MKALFIALFLCLFSLPVYTQEAFNQNIPVGCMSSESMKLIIDKEGLELQSSYLDDYSNYIVELYENKNKIVDRYSIIVKYPIGVSCLLLLGQYKIDVIKNDKLYH